MAAQEMRATTRLNQVRSGSAPPLLRPIVMTVAALLAVVPRLVR